MGKQAPHTPSASSLQEAEARFRSVLQETERQRIEARAERRAAFQREVDAGRTRRDIAEEVGLDQSRVRQILQGRRR